MLINKAVSVRLFCTHFSVFHAFEIATAEPILSIDTDLALGKTCFPVLWIYCTTFLQSYNVYAPSVIMVQICYLELESKLVSL